MTVRRVLNVTYHLLTDGLSPEERARYDRDLATPPESVDPEAVRRARAEDNMAALGFLGAPLGVPG
jgi:hypothetical protein